MKFTLQNKSTGWFRHMHGGTDTSQPRFALRLSSREADRWLADAFHDYRKLPLNAMRREAKRGTGPVD